MKKRLLYALWACLALSTSVHAHDGDEKAKPDNVVLNDTIILNPEEGIKILLIGKNDKTLSLYSNADSLKNLFLADWEKASKQDAYPVDAKLTHYFVNGNGKRRLKSENSEYSGSSIDIDVEKRSLNLDLPPYEYIIYALSNNYEIQIYLNDPEKISRLNSVSIKDGLAAATEDKTVIRQSTRIDIAKQNEHWTIQEHYGNKIDFLEITPSFGMSLLGSRWSPVASVNLSIILHNKYDIPFIKTGLSYSINSFADWNSSEITSKDILSSFDLRLMMNFSDTKQKWFGFQGGFVKSMDKSGPFHNKFKFGVVSEGFSAFNFSFDMIWLKKKDPIYGLTLKLPF